VTSKVPIGVRLYSSVPFAASSRLSLTIDRRYTGALPFGATTPAAGATGRSPNRCADAAERDEEMVVDYEPDAAEAENVDGCRLGFHYSTRRPPQITLSDRHCQLLFFIPAQRPDRWSVDRLTLCIEHRAVTRTIPASFKTVPVQVAAYVGAARRV
jgi:hypothetical protein